MVAIKRKSRTKKRGGIAKRVTEDENSYFVSGISDGAIKRLARRGGIKRFSAGSFKEVRNIFTQFLDKLVTDSYSYAECQRKKTIMSQHVVYALKQQGRNIYGHVFDDMVGGHVGVQHEGMDGFDT